SSHRRKVSIRSIRETGSTQEDQIAASSEEINASRHRSGIRAHTQRPVRGRLGRAWQTEGVQALTVSYVLRTGPAVDQWGTIALRAGVAAVRACQSFGVRVGLKWPNDVVIPAGESDSWDEISKVGGILGSLVRDSNGEHAC